MSVGVQRLVGLLICVPGVLAVAPELLALAPDKLRLFIGAGLLIIGVCMIEDAREREEGWS